MKAWPSGARDERSPEQREAARRWRLVLGRYAQELTPQGQGLGPQDQQIEQSLGYLYDRAYTSRGHLHARTPGKGGSLDPSALTGLNWLAGARELFPKDTFERMQVDAIEKYHLTELLADPQAAAALDPSPELATALLQVRGTLDAAMQAGIRTIITRVVDEIVQRLKLQMTTALSGRRDRNRRSQRRSASTFDWRRTIRANLKNYDPELRRLVLQDLRFSARSRQHFPWDVILCVDQSGSMASSVLYSAVCAGILSAIPGVRVRLVLFDTNVVDLTHLAADPVSVLMTAQLGGGTNIAKALGHCATLVRTPARTVIALVSDFEEGGSVSQLLSTTAALATSGVTLLGLAALDEQANAVYDPHVSGLLAAQGMEIAALTPNHFAEWLGGVLR